MWTGRQNPLHQRNASAVVFSCFSSPPRRGPKIRGARQLKSEFKWGSPSLISTCLPRYSPPVAFYSQCKYVKRRIICMRFDFTPTPKTGSSQKLLHRCEEGSMASGKSIIGVGCHRKPPQSKCWVGISGYSLVGKVIMPWAWVKKCLNLKFWESTIQILWYWKYEWWSWLFKIPEITPLIFFI